MSQIFEYTKHSDRYLIHHFSFEGNDDMSIGRFVGNYSLNKFLSTLEWRMIFDHLATLIERYQKKPKIKRPNDSIDMTDTNIILNVEWSETDAAFYGKIFPNIDLEMVYPFVMVIKVGCKSNVNKFVSSSGEASSQIVANNVSSQMNGPSVSKAKTSTAKPSGWKTPVALTSKLTPQRRKKSASSAVVSTSVTVGSTVYKTLSKTIGSNGIQPFTIPLDRLTVNDIERLTASTLSTNLTASTGGKKRKHQSLNDSASTPQKEIPSKRPSPETSFVNSINSTPYIRLLKIESDTIESDVSRISTEDDKPAKTKAKTKKVKQHQLTKVYLSTKKTGAKSVKNVKPRLQVSIGHLTAKPKKSSKVKKSTHKVKKNKKGSKMVDGESILLEIVEDTASVPFQQPSTSRANNDKENHRPEPQFNGNPQPIDLKDLTEDEVIASFYRNGSLLKGLFKRNVRQDEIQRADDYTPIDIITLLTHQQFSQMLDILYDQFKGYSNEECDTIFFDIIIPEWILAMFMRKTSLQRDAAIVLINSQKTQNHEQSTMLSYISFKEG